MSAGEQRGRTILLVDDERDIVLATRIFLEAEGYNVVEAFDGMEALSKLETASPDLIMLDVVMPRLDGWSTLKKIHTDTRYQDTPVLMLTSLSEPHHVAASINLGATWYYQKPVTDFNDLALVVRRILDMAAAAQAEACGSCPD